MHMKSIEGGAAPSSLSRENGEEGTRSVGEIKTTKIKAGGEATEPFKVVIYVCVAGNASPDDAVSACRAYAERFGWKVTQVIHDNTGLLPPQGRDGLATAMDLIQAKAAGAVLAPYRSMISPRSDEFDEVAAEIEKRGGFLCVRDDAVYDNSIPSRQ